MPGRKTIKACFELFSTLITKIITWFKFLVFNIKNKEKTGNFDGTSNNMETVGTSIIIEQNRE